MGLVLLPLHSSIAIAEQNRVFEHVSASQVKVVISTNIAETSVTIGAETCSSVSFLRLSSARLCYLATHQLVTALF